MSKSLLGGVLLSVFSLSSARSEESSLVFQEDSSVQFGASFLGDYFANVNGGFERGDATSGLVELSLDFDLERLFGLRDTYLHLVTYNGLGTDVSERFVGDVSVVSNAFSSFEFNVFSLYLQHDFDFGHESFLKLGQFAADDDFMTTEAASLFINSSFGVFNTQSTNTPTPIFPLGAPGLFVQYGVNEQLTFKAGVFAGDAGGEDLSNRGFDWRFGGSAGLAYFAEVAYAYAEGSAVTVGGHYHSGDFENFARGGEDSGLGLVYATVNHRFGNGDCPLTGFLRGSVTTNEDRSAASATLDDGVVLENLWYEGTALGLAVSYTKFGDSFVAQNPTLTDRETILELTTLFPLGEHLSIQPDLQFIFDPQNSDEHAIVAGIRLQAKL